MVNLDNQNITWCTMKSIFPFSVPQWWFSTITIPTHITLVRIFLVPFIVMSLLKDNLPLASILFALAALTDVIDGALARSLNATSELGAFLDPIADKLLLISCYACLTYNHFPFNMIPAWFLIVVILQEIIIVWGSIYLRLSRKSNVNPTKLGKMSSFIQILFIGWLFLCSWIGSVPQLPFYLLLTLILCMRIWVLVDYSRIAYYKEQP